MTRTYKTDLLITGDARGGVRAVEMTQKELDKLGTAGKKVGENLNGTGKKLQTFNFNLSSLE